MRDVNENIVRVTEDFELLEDSLEFFCECGTIGCALKIQATINVYEAVRSDAAAFLVSPGHEDLEREKVVYWTDEFVVVHVTAGEPVVA